MGTQHEDVEPMLQFATLNKRIVLPFCRECVIASSLVVPQRINSPPGVIQREVDSIDPSAQCEFLVRREPNCHGLSAVERRARL